MIHKPTGTGIYISKTTQLSILNQNKIDAQMNSVTLTSPETMEAKNVILLERFLHDQHFCHCMPTTKVIFPSMESSVMKPWADEIEDWSSTAELILRGA